MSHPSWIVLTFTSITKTPEVLGLRTRTLWKCLLHGYNVIFLTETWLNDLCYDHNLFPDCFTVFRSDRVSVNKIRGGGVLSALFSRVCSYKRRFNLESCDECVWLEISTSDGLNLLIGNHYFPLDVIPENITNYFRSLENNLDTHNFRLIMVSTGKVYLCWIPIIGLNLREMRSTTPHVFLTLTSALILSLAPIYLI
jgi:hypothetical protein